MQLLCYLRAAGEPDEEVEGKENGDEDLAVLLDPLEFIAQRCYDSLRAAELQHQHRVCVVLKSL